MVYEFIRAYVDDHPCFDLEELKDALTEMFPDIGNFSISTICRGLRHDLGLTKKVLVKKAREAAPIELQDYYNRLLPFYKYPEQLVFIDESSKDGRDAIRTRAWAPRGERAEVEIPFTRGSSVSVMAAFGATGFIAWEVIDGTFCRKKFHEAFIRKVFPKLNPWPLPHSIVIMDTAHIHMYPELEAVIAQAGALLFYLPPYSPQLNPIEVGFSLLKRWIKKHANLAFPHDPRGVLDIAFRMCTEATDDVAINLYDHCGYQKGGLNKNMFFY
jgi:hypothetical protein